MKYQAYRSAFDRLADRRRGARLLVKLRKGNGKRVATIPTWQMVRMHAIPLGPRT